VKLLRPTSVLEVAVDALAVHRLTKLLQDDEVWPVRELREAYLARVGDTRWADLATCPWCLSWWVALAVIAARHRWPRAWPWIARALAGSAVAGHLAHLEDR
jgi:hypothetical protein